MDLQIGWIWIPPSYLGIFLLRMKHALLKKLLQQKGISIPKVMTFHVLKHMANQLQIIDDAQFQSNIYIPKNINIQQILDSKIRQQYILLYIEDGSFHLCASMSRFRWLSGIDIFLLKMPLRLCLEAMHFKILSFIYLMVAPSKKSKISSKLILNLHFQLFLQVRFWKAKPTFVKYYVNNAIELKLAITNW